MERRYSDGSVKLPERRYSRTPYLHRKCFCMQGGFNIVSITDKTMQLNQAKFRINGNSGYILKPDFMLNSNFDPYDRSTLHNIVSPWTLSVRVLAGRHLSRAGRGITSPFVDVEIIGANFDNSKITTKTVSKYPLTNPIFSASTDF